MSIGDRLKTLRDDLGFSQRSLASKIGIHFAQLARYENHKDKPSVDTISKLAKFFEVSTDYLIYGVDKKLLKQAKINDLDLLELLRRIDQLKKPRREKIKWAIQAILDGECSKARTA